MTLPLLSKWLLTGVLGTRNGARRRLDPHDVRFFSGQSHPELAAAIARYLSAPLDPTRFSRFSNDNMQVQLGASVRSRAVFIVQSLIPPVSDHLMELLMMLDIARGAGAREIHAIIPYFSYARSDKKDAPRIAITARLIADLLKAAGATHVMTMTLHSPQVHGFFSLPTDPLTARGLFIAYLARRRFSSADTIVVAPDYGRAGSAARLAYRLKLPVASADKTRVSDHDVRIGDSIRKQVQGFKRVVIYDDEIATGGSVVELSKALLESGAAELIVVCTHGLFTDGALDRLADIPQIVEIVTTDTVPVPKEKRRSNVTVLSVASVFGEAIWRNYTRQSIGDLFAYAEGDTELVKAG
ncbi:MAG: ribose-phosphate pyrophosphokinase [Chloroflexi bacterium]|nr:ribose-phosphate pyrophosphokinase [Chloroflexota bacterium]